MDLKYIENRKAFEAHFSTYTEIEDSREEFLSPSSLYKLQVSAYGPGQQPAWRYSRGVVSRQSDGHIIADVKRNIGHFWHAWVEHPNGNEYLLCGEDYQGYSVVNLSSTSYQTYFPEEGHKGFGFCWTAVYPSPDKLTLAINGCYWGGPTEIVFYDFRTPDFLPYKELGREGKTSWKLMAGLIMKPSKLNANSHSEKAMALCMTIFQKPSRTKLIEAR